MITDEEMEQHIRTLLEMTKRAGAMTRTSDLGSAIWCFVIELDDPEVAAVALRVGKRLYLEERARQVLPS